MMSSRSVECQDAVRNRQALRWLGYCVEGECGVPTRANCGRFFGLEGPNLEKVLHVPGGQGFGQNLGFPEEALQFPSLTSYGPPDTSETPALP